MFLNEFYENIHVHRTNDGTAILQNNFFEVLRSNHQNSYLVS